MSEILEGRKFKCAFCRGSGVQPHSLASRCLSCRGKGEVEFEGPVIQCPSCVGTGKAPNSAILSCIQCKGVGVVEKGVRAGDSAEIVGQRLGEIANRLKWAKREAEKKTKEIEKKLKPIRPFVKDVKKETLWLKKIGDTIKKGWEFLWKD